MGGVFSFFFLNLFALGYQNLQNTEDEKFSALLVNYVVSLGMAWLKIITKSLTAFGIFIHFLGFIIIFLAISKIN